MADKQRAEECRHVVLGYLVNRPSVAQAAATIHHRLTITEWDFSLIEVQEACGFLAGMELVKEITDPMGSTKHYQATSTGILQHERASAV